MNSKNGPTSKVWDWPLRLWHWLFGTALAVALATGLVDELKSIEVHQWAGISAIALLAFRIVWGFCGGTYARWQHYWTTPRKIWNHFKGNGVLTPHTAPGIALVVILMVATVMQSTSGLFMTDDVLFDGPLNRYANDEVLEVLDNVHHNAWRVVLVCIATHLAAQLIYGVVLRDSTPLGMFSGKKHVALPTAKYPAWGLVFSSLVAVAVVLVLTWLSD